MASPIFTRGIRPTLLGNSSPMAHGLRVRGWHPVSRGFQADYPLHRVGLARVHTPHLPHVIRAGFGLACSQFGRPYYGNRCCFLFLRVLGCFASAGSRSRGRFRPRERTGLLDPCRKSHSGIWGSTAACTYPQHFVACHALPRRPSQVIQQTAFACRTNSDYSVQARIAEALHSNARSIGTRGLNASPVGLARTPRAHQTRLHPGYSTC